MRLIVRLWKGGRTAVGKIGIIADDLTGANDSGVQLVKKGLRSSVVFDYHPLTTGQIEMDALIIDTDSRALSKNEAYEAVQKAALFLKQNGFTHMYKKVDSTLRGNLGAEIEAVTKIFEPDFCIIAPAFPRIGRTTKNGIHYLHGIPLTETEVAKDPKTPVLESSIPQLLESQANQKVGLVRTGDLGSDLALWKSELTHWREKGVQWLVFDAETDEHLKSIASCISSITEKVVWVGSAGLAEYLPEELGLVNVDSVKPLEVKNTDVLVVSGSLSSVTRKQISRLLEMDGIMATEVDPLTVFEEDDRWERWKQTYVKKLNSTYQEGFQAVLFVDSSSENREHTAEAGKRLGLSPSQVSNRISKGLGEIASEFLKQNSSVKGLVLTGGDTAKDVCRQIAASGLELLKEVEPGIPFGRLAGDHEMYMITKAGAFGTEITLVNAVLALKGERNE